MTSRLKIIGTVFALLITASSLAGCNFEPGERTQLVGQECLADQECVTGALCVERVCRYEASAQLPDVGSEDAGGDASPDAADAGPGDAATDVPDPDDVWFLDIGQDGGQAPDIPRACRPTASRCISNTQFEYCREDGSGFDTLSCEDGLRCQNGECI